MGKKSEMAFGPVTSCFIGVGIGFAICWFSMVRQLNANHEAREKSLQEWDRINRMEREAIATIKTINTEELRKWVATLDDQNTRYTQLQRQLHQQELAMTGPSTTYIVIALIAVLGVAGFVAWMIRDGNADAARTLNDAVAVLPPLREALQARLVRDVTTDSMPIIRPSQTVIGGSWVGQGGLLALLASAMNSL